MGRRRIAGDHEIQVHHDRRAVHECIGARIEFGAQCFHRHTGRKVCQLFSAVVFLQADQGKAGDMAQRSKGTKRDRAADVDICGGFALPQDSDSKLTGGQSLGPSLHTSRLGKHIGNISRYGFGSRS